MQVFTEGAPFEEARARVDAAERAEMRLRETLLARENALVVLQDVLGKLIDVARRGDPLALGLVVARAESVFRQLAGRW